MGKTVMDAMNAGEKYFTRRKEEEKRRKEQERKNKSNWFKSKIDTLTKELFDDDKM